MADYGLLNEVRIEPRTAELTTAAAIADTELVIDDAGDLDEDGGTLDLNGTQLEYTGIEWGSTEDDSDTVLLADPLAVGADVGDLVTQVVGGLAAEDWYAVVDMNGGDPVPVPIRFDQRQSWPEGIYDPPQPVVVSEDLMSLEDAPGRPAVAASRVEAWNADEWDAAGDDADSPGDLTYTPRPNSLLVFNNGIRIPNDAIDLNGKVATALAAGTDILADDKFSSWYLYDPGAALVGSGSNASPFIEAVQALQPIWFPVQDDSSGVTQADYSGFGRDGTYVNGVSLGAASVIPSLPTRTSADYDGANDFSASPVAAWLNVPQIAILATFNADTIGTTIRTLCARNNLAGTASFGLWITTGGKLHFEANTSAGTEQVTGSTTIVAGTDYIAAAIYDGSTVQCLLGSVGDTLAADASPAAASGTVNTSLSYGAQVGAMGVNGVSLADLFDGRIGAVALFDPSATGLTAADLIALHPLWEAS